MEVKDIFNLRKEGKTAEAYQLISDRYAQHKGKYTTMCMFWCTDDMFKLAVGNGEWSKAKRFLYNMTLIYPATGETDERAVSCIVREAVEMDRHIEDFNLAYFMPYFCLMGESDWLTTSIDGHPVPSLGQQVVNHLLKSIDKRDAEYIENVAPLFQKAIQLAPNYKENLRHMAQMKVMLGKKDEAVEIYKRLLNHHHDAYLYAELAELTDDNNGKIALYAQAVLNQRRPKFASRYHLRLAELLQKRSPERAIYELGKYSEALKLNGKEESSAVKNMLKALSGTTPVSEKEETAFYYSAQDYANKMIQG